MYRLLLCIIIVAACGFMGIAKAASFKNRVSDLQDIKSIFKILQREMSYKKDPLPEAFDRISKYQYNRASELLAVCAEKLRSSSALGFNDPWKEAIQETYAGTDLKDEDMAIVEEMGQQLGKSHIRGQESMFELVDARLEHQLYEALEDKKTRGKMYKSLGFSVGIIIAVVFF